MGRSPPPTGVKGRHGEWTEYHSAQKTGPESALTVTQELQEACSARPETIPAGVLTEARAWEGGRPLESAQYRERLRIHDDSRKSAHANPPGSSPGTPPALALPLLSAWITEPHDRK